jgi:phosphate transport system substrate-binding protein
MKNKYLSVLSLVLLSLFSTATLAATTITGAGATFPYPLYTKWAEKYDTQTSVRLNYQPIGSGGGIKQIQAKTVDFGASDKPLSAAELDASKLIQFPTVIGGVVPVVNIPNIKNGEVKLSGSVLADIYLGKIKKWNDAKIVALNAGITLPDADITVVHRSDGSGTTFLFTDYLGKASAAWKKQVGSDTAVSWPGGIGGKGNEGVAAYVQRLKNSIGYVEYAYAEQNGLVFAQLINRSGQAVSPSIAAFEAASVNAKWNAQTQFAEILTDQEGAKSWPITGATFILMQRVQDDPAKGKAVLKFFDWAYSDGKTLTTKMDYAPLPDAVVKMIEAHWKETLKDGAGNSVWQ